jgi:hypothetical protein
VLREEPPAALAAGLARVARRQPREEPLAALAADLARVAPDSNLMQRLALEVAVARAERRATLQTRRWEAQAAALAVMVGEPPEKTWQQRMPTWSAIPSRVLLADEGNRRVLLVDLQNPTSAVWSRSSAM